jgi:RNase adaptor protein for sRNA GlmZ degradation
MIFCRQSQMIRALRHQLSPLGTECSARTSLLFIDESQELIRRLDRVRRRDPSPPTIVLRLEHLHILEVARLNLAIESGNRDNGLSK